jgi:chemotaxis protein methyltransferase CheR
MALDKARRGIFTLSSIKGHTANYQQAGGKQAFSDYYSAAYDAAIFDPSLRENVTFSDHSLATDSVFSEIQLVLCRNVLIYFNRPLQDRALGLFHESLSHRGFMALGGKESIQFSGYATHFEVLDKSARIFRKRQMAPPWAA